MPTLPSAISSLPSSSSSPTPEKRPYAPLKSSPLNPNVNAHHQQQRKNTYSSSLGRRRGPGPGLSYDYGHKPGGRGPNLAAPARPHRLSLLPTQESPGQRLLRQKAAVAWRCETLRHHLLGMGRRAPGTATSDTWAPLQPAASSSELRYPRPRQQHHHRSGARCGGENTPLVTIDLGGPETMRVTTQVMTEPEPLIGFLNPSSGGGSSTQRAVERALFAAESYHTRWRADLVVPMPFDDDDEGVGMYRNRDEDEDEGSDYRDNQREAHEATVQSATVTSGRDVGILTASSENLSNENDRDSAKRGSVGVVIYPRPGETSALGCGGGQDSDIEIEPDVGLLSRRRRMLAERRGFLHATRPKVHGSKRLRSTAWRVSIVAAVVLGIVLAYGLVVAFGGSGGRAAGGRPHAERR
ncbi:hypothetical protein VTJ49DRAFT_2142 [Mycothermus thermophilus]|uniref:Uncharacterized protein n=1 Tax=Humicola insolens TaxID=85995 RepID=A0ABR3VPE9_HUMIN